MKHSIMVRVGLVAWISVAAATCCSLPSVAAAEGTIAFIRSGDVWIMESDGANQQRLTETGGCLHPTWSPDGAYLVFERNANLVRLTLADGHLQQLTTSGDAHQPAWRPGTGEIWYVRLGKPDGFGSLPVWLWALDTATGKARRVATIASDFAAGPGRTSWRPDGKTLAIDLEEAGEGGGIYFRDTSGREVTVDLEGVNQRWGTWAESNAAWHPTAPGTIAVARLYRDEALASEFAWSLALIDTITRRETRIFDASCSRPDGMGGLEHDMVSWPSWAPDGTAIAYVLSRWAGGRFPHIWRLPAAGGEPTLIVQNGRQPAWSPAGARPGPQTGPPAQGGIAGNRAPSEEMTGPDGQTLVWVPPGSFAMGSEDAGHDESPVHRVTLGGFWIGKHEVTNAQYRTFCNDTGRVFPAESDQGDDHPVVHVNWHDAQAYCIHYGYALPTEAQWEYAAAGPEAHTYPWGDVWDPLKCCYWHNRGPQGQTFPVGTFPAGASWCGALDMAGNVAEWCADWYASDYYANSPESDPPGPATGERKMLRGGSFALDDYAEYFRCAHRYRSAPPEEHGNYIGFRCTRTQ